jgi:hypothetical protein
MSIPAQLKDARRSAGVTQAEADCICGLGKGQFAAWESGRNVPLDVTIEGVLMRLRAAKKRTPRKGQNDELSDDRRK